MKNKSDPFISFIYIRADGGPEFSASQLPHRRRMRQDKSYCDLSGVQCSHATVSAKRCVCVNSLGGLILNGQLIPKEIISRNPNLAPYRCKTMPH